MDNITLMELYKIPENEYTIIDIRDPLDFEYGHLPNAVNITLNEIKDDHSVLPKDKMLILCCKSGMISAPLADELRECGFNAVNLIDGYYGWLRCKFADESKIESVKKSLETEFRYSIWDMFVKAIKKYKLVNNRDHIAVCISGGKDSMLMAKLFYMLKEKNEIDFQVTYLVMDPGYSPINRETIEKNAKSLGIPLTVFETNIFNYVYKLDKHPCYMCARLRRGNLYSQAQKLGCNKIALGHHYDDVIETILMGMIYGGQIQTMMPKLHSENFEGMEIIRPLYLVREDEIKRWRDYNDLQFIQCACRFTDTCTTCNPTGTGSKRQEVKRLIAELKETNINIEDNIFSSIENVNLNYVLEYKSHNKRHYFMDNY